MSTWSRSQKVCATCRYWGGERAIHILGQSVKPTSPTGVCQGPDDSLRGTATPQASTCAKWSLFTA
ncbi:hypothetical protein [Alicyclobacillus sp. ALC3]|uniref:hypothetical protein n=1 Tax=Alicyclobacillus sp. ALC3 TaxID=2796143 RepID=UPI00237872F7|nr:hypothetical protein [Alicyclobacillus sp. ALC3]WDL95373.1 hypothetical protein JC200_13225 [Alicyclobacillus sp. ALC3]